MSGWRLTILCIRRIRTLCSGPAVKISVIRCVLPAVSGVWWGAQMNAIFAVTGQARISAALTPRNTPCCGAPVVIPDMDYDETGGLACYGLTVRYNNSFIVCMDNGRDEIIHRVSECLGTPVRLVWEWI